MEQIAKKGHMAKGKRAISGNMCQEDEESGVHAAQILWGVNDFEVRMNCACEINCIHQEVRKTL